MSQFLRIGLLSTVLFRKNENSYFNSFNAVLEYQIVINYKTLPFTHLNQSLTSNPLPLTRLTKNSKILVLSKN